MGWIRCRQFRHCLSLRLLILPMLFKCSKADDDLDDDGFDDNLPTKIALPVMIAVGICVLLCCEHKEDDADSEMGSYHSGIEMDQIAAPAVRVARRDVENSGGGLPTPSMRLVEPLPPPPLNSAQPPSYHSLFPART